MQLNQRITLRDIAKEVGVSAMTVSLALRDSPKLPKETQDKIKKVAEEMGYKSDPMLSALNAHKTGKRIASYHGTIAFLTDCKKDSWSVSPEGPIGILIAAIKKRAQELGYTVEVFYLTAKQKEHGQLDRTLYNRGIRAIILGHFDQPVEEIALKWKRYCVVSLTHQINSIRFHSVMNDHYQSMRLVMNKLKEAGYKRPGYCISRHWSDVTDNYWLAAFLLERRHHPKEDRVEPLITNSERVNKKEFRAWLKEHTPDAIITLSEAQLDWLKEDGYKVPEEIGFAHLDQFSPEESSSSGILQDRHLLGRVAVDQLNLIFQRGAYGQETTSTSLQVASTWLDRGTTR
jgi:LacI family transcriptional regulator